jgi:erythromycin esterase
VKHLGFTAIAVETNMSDARAVDAYVSGREPMSRRVAQSVFSANEHFRWTEEPFEENLELIRWIRGHNDEAQEKVRFFGIDAGWSMAAPPEWDASVQVLQALGHLSAVAGGGAARLQAALEPFVPRFNSVDQWSFLPDERRALSELLGDLLAAVAQRRDGSLSERDEWEGAYRAARVARVLDPVAVERRGPRPSDEDEFRGERDASMAENVECILTLAGHRKVFVFASDGHVSRARWPSSDPAWPYPAMGELLAPRLGDEMAVICSAHRGGASQGVDGIVEDAGPTLSPVLDERMSPQEDLPGVIDLRVEPWGSDPSWDRLRRCCDALLVLDQVSPVRPLNEEL